MTMTGKKLGLSGKKLSLLIFGLFTLGAIVIALFLNYMISFAKGNLVDLYGLDAQHYELNTQKNCFVYKNIYDNQSITIDAKEFTLFSWNIYKQKLAAWDIVFAEALRQSDIVLLQEAKQSSSLIYLIKEHGFNAIHAIAFKHGTHTNGVMNIAKAQPYFYCAQKESEPWIRFPKSGLISTYALNNNQILMVANFHAINFSMGLKEFTKQVDNVFAILAAHIGPIVLAGDFNTWRDARYDLVVHKIKQIKLTEVTYEQDNRTQVLGKKLDYVFTRGVIIKKAEVLTTKASDHQPIKITMASE